MSTTETFRETQESLPIWMAALVASGCEARVNGEALRVEWLCVSDRAVYTNGGDETIVLLPFGVPVRAGESVVVSWLPGETAYTITAP